MSDTYIRPGFPVLYLDDNPDDHLLVQGAAAMGRLPLHIHSMTRLSLAIDYLSGDRRFHDRQRYPLPVLVLLDYDLCGGTAIDLLRWMRVQPQFDGLPVVMFTSSDTPEHIARCYAHGANHFLVKPSGYARVEAVLQTLALCFAAHPPDFKSLSQLPEYRPPLSPTDPAHPSELDQNSKTSSPPDPPA